MVFLNLNTNKETNNGIDDPFFMKALRAPYSDEKRDFWNTFPWNNVDMSWEDFIDNFKPDPLILNMVALSHSLWLVTQFLEWKEIGEDPEDYLTRVHSIEDINSVDFPVLGNPSDPLPINVDKTNNYIDKAEHDEKTVYILPWHSKWMNDLGNPILHLLIQYPLLLRRLGTFQNEMKDGKTYIVRDTIKMRENIDRGYELIDSQDFHTVSFVFVKVPVPDVLQVIGEKPSGKHIAQIEAKLQNKKNELVKTEEKLRELDVQISKLEKDKERSTQNADRLMRAMTRKTELEKDLEKIDEEIAKLDSLKDKMKTRAGIEDNNDYKKEFREEDRNIKRILSWAKEIGAKAIKIVPWNTPKDPLFGKKLKLLERVLEEEKYAGLFHKVKIYATWSPYKDKGSEAQERLAGLKKLI